LRFIGRWGQGHEQFHKVRISAMSGLTKALFSISLVGFLGASGSAQQSVQPGTPAQGQQPAAGQPAKGQPLPGAGQRAQPTIGGFPAQGQPISGRSQQQFQGTPGSSSFYYGNMPQTGWFNNQAVQQHLNLDNNQLNALNQSYGQYWNQYQGELNKLGNPTGQNWSNGVQGVWSNYNNQLLNAAQGTLAPEQFQRFQQLNLQHQGMFAFTNPAIQDKLNLTPQQRTQLSNYLQQQYAKEAEIYRNYANDPQAGAQAYQALRQQAGTDINGMLTPQQQQTWSGMVGNQYQFGPYWQ
jgi:hypothetical protein